MNIYYFLFFLMYQTCLSVNKDVITQNTPLIPVPPVKIGKQIAPPVIQKPAASAALPQGSAGEQLLAAVSQAKLEIFKSVATRILNQYKNNKKELFSVLDTRDKYGYNVLQNILASADLEYMNFFFKELKKIYKNDPQGFYDYMATVDTANGMNALGWAQHSYNRYAMAFFLMRCIEMLGKEKNLFFKLFYAADKYGWHPLVNAIDDAETMNVKLMVTAAAQVLGVDSKEFDQFINRVDSDGDAAVDLAKTRYDELLLLRFGARPHKKEKKDVPLEEVKNLAKELINISNRDTRDAKEIKEFNKVLKKGMRYCVKDPRLAYYLFAGQEEDGWTPIMNVASAGQYDFMVALLNGMRECFTGKNQYIKYHVLRLTEVEGRSPLHIVIMRKNFKTATALLDYIVENPIDPLMIFTILNLPNEFNGFTSLTSLLYILSGNDTHGVRFLEHMMKKIAALFPKGSRKLELIVNSRDYNWLNPLAYVISPNIRKIMRDYGATDYSDTEKIGYDDLEKLMGMYTDLTEHLM